MNAVHVVALVAHLIGLVLGLGGATMTDVLFVTCIRQRRADETLTLVMTTAARVVVVGYTVLVASGVLLVVSGSPTSQRFWSKMIVVGVFTCAAAACTTSSVMFSVIGASACE